ncbi:MAG: VOC family protein [Candidatus Omnitrophica bacterium]|nr:VOC family protein [Candidatus Omnitrophota bacterium]
MIDVTAIDHVCLSVSSLARAQEYYERVFGASCNLREGDPRTLVVEAARVHFFLSKSPASSEFLSSQHLSLRVNSLDDVIAALNALGITKYKTGVVSFFKHNNYRWCAWKDPDGIRLECVEMLKGCNT